MAMGAGDFLMAFLGCVIVSFGFRIYQQVRCCDGWPMAQYINAWLLCIQYPVSSCCDGSRLLDCVMRCEGRGVNPSASASASGVMLGALLDA
jgi:hypothetical protein